jgi:hypothetical protein
MAEQKSDTIRRVGHGEVSEIVGAESGVVFDLIHDYDRRLEWDTLLKAAYLVDGETTAGVGVESVCVGRNMLGGLALRTVYVTFRRPTVAAVKLVNSPPFFRTWAASIHHEDTGAGESRVTYKFHFTVKPALLSFVLDPLMSRIFVWETRKRLRALKAYLGGGIPELQSTRVTK